MFSLVWLKVAVVAAVLLGVASYSFILYNKGKDAARVEQMRQTLKDLEVGREVDNDLSNLSECELARRLREWASDRHEMPAQEDCAQE